MKLGARPRGEGARRDVNELEGTPHEVREGQTRFISLREAYDDNKRAISDILRQMGQPISKLTFVKSNKGSNNGQPIGLSDACVRSITASCAALIKLGAIPCPQARNGTLHIRVWAALDKLAPRQVELRFCNVMDPTLARRLLRQYCIDKAVNIHRGKGEVEFDADPAQVQPGWEPMAQLIDDPVQIRIGPRRLYGSVNGKDTHYEIAGDSGKLVTKSNPENTFFTTRGVEIRASTMYILGAVSTLCERFAEEYTDLVSSPRKVALGGMIPWGSDAMSMHRFAENTALVDFGTLLTIGLEDVYDGFIQCGQTVFVTLERSEVLISEGLSIARLSAKVTFIDDKSLNTALSMNGISWPPAPDNRRHSRSLPGRRTLS
jgi:hypothetical protein